MTVELFDRCFLTGAGGACVAGILQGNKKKGAAQGRSFLEEELN